MLGSWRRRASRSSATAEGRSSDFRPDVQGLRAVAILLVVAFHAGLPVGGGYLGVDVFFVISGYVITLLLLRELETTGRLSFGRFYRRRAQRLLPALALMLVTVAFASVWFDSVGAAHTRLWTGITAALFTANYYLYNVGTSYFSVASSFNPLLHTWSLSVEEQFYLLYPASLLVGWYLVRRFLRRRLQRPALAALASAVLLGSLLLTVLIARHGGIAGHPFRNGGRSFAFYSMPTRAWELAAGVVLALTRPWIERAPHTLASAAGWLGAVLVGAAAWAVRPTDAPGLLAVAGAALLILAGDVDPSRGPARVLAAAPMRWIGDRSYGWYLWHLPLIVWAAGEWRRSPGLAVAPALVSLGIAALSYRFVENPVRRSRLSGRRALVLAAVCVALPISALAGMASASGVLASYQPPSVWGGACTNAPLGTPACTFSPSGRRTLVLIGDSNARQFVPALLEIAKALRMRLMVANKDNCPFALVTVVLAGPPTSPAVDSATRRACREFVTRSMALALRLRPALVVIADRDASYLEDHVKVLATWTGSGATNEPARKALLWQAGLEGVLRRLVRDSIHVLLVRPIPEHLGWSFAECSLLSIRNHTCRNSISRASVDERRALALAAEDGALREVPAVARVDLAGFLCRHGTCPTFSHGTFIYADEGHLSVAGALSVERPLERAIRDALH